MSNPTSVDLKAQINMALSSVWKIERSLGIMMDYMLEQRSEHPSEQDKLTPASVRARLERLKRTIKRLEPNRSLMVIVPTAWDDEHFWVDQIVEKAHGLSNLYKNLAEIARRVGDPETAFACELNRIGAEEMEKTIELFARRSK